MTYLRNDFVAVCLRNNVPVEVAEELFKAVGGFAAFGFCRSHAAAFARTSHETAWLRLNFPAEYYCGLLNNQPRVLPPERAGRGRQAPRSDATARGRECVR